MNDITISNVEALYEKATNDIDLLGHVFGYNKPLLGHHNILLTSEEEVRDLQSYLMKSWKCQAEADWYNNCYESLLGGSRITFNAGSHDPSLVFFFAKEGSQKLSYISYIDLDAMGMDSLTLHFYTKKDLPNDEGFVFHSADELIKVLED